MPIRAHVDENAFVAFTDQYFNTPLPAGSVSTILTDAFNALLAAGVVVIDGSPTAGHYQFYVHGGRVWLYWSDSADGTDSDHKAVWTGEGMPSFTPVVRAVAELMNTVLNAAPYRDALDFPHTRN